MPRSKASIAKQKATIAAKKASRPMSDVRSAILCLRSIRARMVKDIASGALAFPTLDHVDALNALRALQGRG